MYGCDEHFATLRGKAVDLGRGPDLKTTKGLSCYRYSIRPDNGPVKSRPGRARTAAEDTIKMKEMVITEEMGDSIIRIQLDHPRLSLRRHYFDLHIWARALRPVVNEGDVM